MAGDYLRQRRIDGSVVGMKMVSGTEVAAVLTGSAGDYTVSNYIGSYRDLETEAGGQAFLVEQRSAELRAHFHEVDQFQVFVGGSGVIGGDDVGFGSIHYADSYTAYGPIRTASSGGVAYFTLRLSSAVGANFMPQARRKRPAARRPPGHFTCSVSPLPDGRPDHARLDLLAESSRGARASRCQLPAGTVIGSDLLGTATGKGYAVVLSGSVRAAGRALPERSLIAFDRGGELAGVAADAGGAMLAVVTFPGEN